MDLLNKFTDISFKYWVKFKYWVNRRVWGGVGPEGTQNTKV